MTEFTLKHPEKLSVTNTCKRHQEETPSIKLLQLQILIQPRSQGLLRFQDGD